MRVQLSLAVVLVALVATAARAASGDSFGSADEAACVPPGPSELRCENRVMKAWGKAVVCVGRCHIARAKERLADGAAEEACEQDCQGKYARAVDRVAALCPPDYDARATGPGRARDPVGAGGAGPRARPRDTRSTTAPGSRRSTSGSQRRLGAASAAG
jgi:hypothetical protein